MPDWGSMSADQINASMGLGPGGVGDQSQALLNNIFNNFGQQTDYYSALGAAYGRQTGGFGAVDPAYGSRGLPGGGGGTSSDGPAPFGGPDTNTYGYPGSGSLGSSDAFGGYAPSGGHWDLGLNAWIPDFNDRYSAAPAIDPNLQPQGYSLPTAIWAGVNPSATPPQTSSSFDSRFSAAPGGGSDPNWTAFGGMYGSNPSPNVWSPQAPSGGHWDLGLNTWVNDSGAGYNYFDPSIYAPAAQGNLGGGVPTASSRDQIAQQLMSGGSSSYPYSGSPYYMPPSMPAQQPWSPQGGGLGQPGFGVGGDRYTGQPGYGLAIGQVPSGTVPPPSGGYLGLPDYPGAGVMGGSAFEMPAQVWDSGRGGA